MLFDIRGVTSENFEAHALQLFRYQYESVPVYKQYVDLIGVKASIVKRLGDIPFLPISFFKTHDVVANDLEADTVFYSSTTTGAVPSKHLVADVDLYRRACVNGFDNVYGDGKDWCFLALLPSYLERGQSSLVWMVNEFIKLSAQPSNGFYLNEYEQLEEIILQNEANQRKTMLIGVSYALLDLAESWSHQGDLKHAVIMETGGMKGRRKEMLKEELHAVLSKAFHVSRVHSEYGMTELLSQAYSTGGGIYHCPHWMKIFIRDINDPFNILNGNGTGAVNVVDLANQYSCGFIATDDLGKAYADGSFTVLGRLDTSETRGCNLMVE